MDKLLIIGSGDLGQLIAHHAIVDNHYKVVGFIDDFAKNNESVMGIPILGNLNDLEKLKQDSIFDVLMLGVGYKHMIERKNIFEKLSQHYQFGNVIHSSAFVDPLTKLGSGIFILPGCTIDAHVTICDNVLLNTACTIAHDTTIKKHCFLSPRVSIAGKSIIEESCIIGINATIIDNVTVAANIRIGAGSVVVKNLNDEGTYLGIPAKLKQ